MNDLTLSWKKIVRGLPYGRKSANDRAPTVEELQKLIEYPDRELSEFTRMQMHICYSTKYASPAIDNVI
jgi:hypothetical protein